MAIKISTDKHTKKGIYGDISATILAAAIPILSVCTPQNLYACTIASVLVILFILIKYFETKT